MATFLATLVVFGLALLAMAVGALTGRSRIRGSCGGVAGRCEGWGEPTCDLCRPERRRAPREVT
jgi:hypothetical protein